MSTKSFDEALPAVGERTDPTMWGARRIAEADVLLVTDGSGVRIEGFAVPRSLRRRGLGSEALRLLTALADEHGVPLELTAAPLDRESDITTEDLIRFYERAGFIFAGPDGWREPLKVSEPSPPIWDPDDTTYDLDALTLDDVDYARAHRLVSACIATVLWVAALVSINEPVVMFLWLLAMSIVVIRTWHHQRTIDRWQARKAEHTIPGFSELELSRRAPTPRRS